jgi:hypothetical protein
MLTSHIYCAGFVPVLFYFWSRWGRCRDNTEDWRAQSFSALFIPLCCLFGILALLRTEQSLRNPGSAATPDS